MTTEPREGSLDDPAARLDGKADLACLLADDLDGDERGRGETRGLRRGHALTGATALGEGTLDDGIEAAFKALLNKELASIAFINPDSFIENYVKSKNP